MMMKTIDDVIEQCEEIANASKQHTLHMTHFSQSYDEWAEEWTQIAEWLKELKAYKENTCGDAISRQAVMEHYSTGEIAHCHHVSRNNLLDFIEQLPSVTPQQRTGRWIEVIDEIDSLGNKTWHHECSICRSDKSGWGTYKHCPDCGAKMEVEEMTRDEAMTRDKAIGIIECGDISNRWGKDGEEVEKMAIKALEQEPNKWIPVSKRLPNKKGTYLVTQKATFPDYVYRRIAGYALNLHDVDEYDFADKKRSGWYEYDSEWGYRELDGVIAWMPLPEPYKAESEE